MPGPRRSPFEYAIVRVVPRVERGEMFNAGIVLHSRPRRFLEARVELDVAVLPVAGPRTATRPRSSTTSRRSRGSRPATRPPDRSPGSVGRSGSTGWSAPSSTIVQPSAVHTGLTDDPAATLDHLFATLVRDVAEPLTPGRAGGSAPKPVGHGPVREGHLDQRALGDHRVEVGPAPGAGDLGEDRRVARPDR